MKCGVHGCCNEYNEYDPDNLGVCFDCCIKIARRYKVRILAEEAMERDARHKAQMEKIRAERAKPKPIAELFAAYEQPAGSTWVYYVRIHDHIKIGYSKNVLKRLSALRVPVSNLLALEPGGFKLEQERHEQFDHLRVTKRWENFHPEPDLLVHIDALVQQHGMPKWLKSPRRGKNGPVEVRRAG